MLKKLIQDIDNLEKFYSNKEYRNELISQARYHSFEYVQLEHILEQDKKVKEKLNLPENCTIRYEKVKCSKNCKHNTLGVENNKFIKENSIKKEKRN